MRSYLLLLLLLLLALLLLLLLLLLLEQQLLLLLAHRIRPHPAASHPTHHALTPPTLLLRVRWEWL